MGRVHKHMQSISNTAMQGVGHNIQIQDNIFVILKHIQTKMSACFDSIILFILWGLISWQGGWSVLHVDSWCVHQE